jgi:hypothetical protein
VYDDITILMWWEIQGAEKEQLKRGNTPFSRPAAEVNDIASSGESFLWVLIACHVKWTKLRTRQSYGDWFNVRKPIPSQPLNHFCPTVGAQLFQLSFEGVICEEYII